MDDHLDEDRRLGELLHRDLPVPEHREGYRERLAALMTAEAVERAGAKKRMPRFLPKLRWVVTGGTEEHVDGRRRPSGPDRRRSGALRAAAIAFTVVVLIAGLGTGIFEAFTHLGKNGPVLIITDEPMPAAVMSGAEIGQWKADAAAFGDRFYGAWPDADAVVAIVDAEYADDAVYYDPSNGEFGIEGKQNIMAACRQFFAVYPDLHPQVTGMYLSTNTAVYRLSEEGALELYPFKDGRATRADHWWSVAGLEAWGDGCFAPGYNGAEQLQEIAERYLDSWSSGEQDRIAALYGEDARFSDTMFGLQAEGSEAIAELGSKRFGPDSTVTFEIIDLYAQTNGTDPPTEQLPEHGAIIGVGIHYRATVVAGSRSATIDGLTTFELGTRIGQAFALDPDGLIDREEVFYDVDSLVAAGLIP